LEKHFDEQFHNYLERINEFLESNNLSEIKILLDELHPQDIAEILLELENKQAQDVFALLSWKNAALVLEDVDGETFSMLIRLMSFEQKKHILENMSDDDIADLLNDLSENKVKEIMTFLDRDHAADVKELLYYDEDSAGGIMTKEFVALKADYTIFRAIETLREIAPDKETIYYVFVIDNDNKLVGVISLRDLIIAKPNQTVKDNMSEKVIHVNVNDDQEEVAKIVSKYNLLAVPVIDNDDKLVGIITVDDIIDVIEEEATEDIMKFAGTTDEEYYEDDSFKVRIGASVRSRLPWLVITVFGGLVSAQVIGLFQGVIDANTTITLFMPILAGMGGNVGTQSSTITVRNIATGNVYGKDVFKTLIHEFSVGFLVGLVCSVMAGSAALILKGDIILSIIVGIAMWVNIITAATIGTAVPLIFKKIGVDPAVASAPFISTTVDITGLSIYFTLAHFLIKALIP
jgi:magnesium transporter